jgi:hypothetical protein
MEPWLLLLFSVGMAWITVEMVRWFGSLQRLKHQDLERIAGVDTQTPNLPPDAGRAWRSISITKSLNFVFFLLLVCCLITVSLVIATVKAFSSAL